MSDGPGWLDVAGVGIFCLALFWLTLAALDDKQHQIDALAARISKMEHPQ